MNALDPVQLAALEFSKDKPGVGWFAEQGLGKSLMALAEFDHLVKENKADRMIIIAPNTFKRGWHDEIVKHGFDFDVHIFRSAKREAATEFVKLRHSKPPVFIIERTVAAQA